MHRLESYPSTQGQSWLDRHAVERHVEVRAVETLGNLWLRVMTGYGISLHAEIGGVVGAAPTRFSTTGWLGQPTTIARRCTRLIRLRRGLSATPVNAIRITPDYVLIGCPAGPIINAALGCVIRLDSEALALIHRNSPTGSSGSGRNVVLRDP